MTFGLHCVGKRPLNDDWQKRPNTIEAIAADRAALPSATNTGLRTARLPTIDIDTAPAPAEYLPDRYTGSNPDHTEEIAQLVYEVLGANEMWRVGSKGGAIPYRMSTPLPKIRITGEHPVFKKTPASRSPPNGNYDKEPRPKPWMIAVEILGNGQQFVAYGIHPDTHQPYRWPNERLSFEPLQMPHAELPEVTPEKLRELAAKCAELFKSLGYVNVKISDRGNPVAGANREAKRRQDKTPVPKDYLIEMLATLDPSCGRDDWIRILAGIQATPLRDVAEADMDAELVGIADAWSRGGSNYEGRADVEHAYYSLDPMKPGGATFGTLYHLAKEAGWDREPPQPTAQERFGGAAALHAQPGDWPEMIDIFGDLVTGEPELRPDMLPAPIWNYAVDMARGLGVSPAEIAIPTLPVCAAALHSEFVIQPRENDTEWREDLNLWTLLAKNSGGAKTESQKKATRPIIKVQGEWRDEDAKTFAEYEQRKERYQERKRNKELEESEPPPEKPEPRSLIVHGFTIEGMRDALVNSPHGKVLCIANEITSLIGTFGAYNNAGEGDRGLFLELFDGGGKNILRAGKQIWVPNWGACSVANVQVSKLQTIIGKQGLADDGLLQRYLIYTGERRRGIDRAPDAVTIGNYEMIVNSLLKQHPRLAYDLDQNERPPVSAIIKLDNDAQPYRQAIEELCDALAEDDRLISPLQQCMSKMRGIGMRLMGVLHAIECVYRGRNVCATRVSAATAKQAYELVRGFFVPQAIHTYSVLFPACGAQARLREIADGILTLDKLDDVSIRDIYRKVGAYRDPSTHGELRLMLARLERDGIARQTAPEKWSVNPQFRVRNAARATDTARRYAEAHKRAIDNREAIRRAYAA